MVFRATAANLDHRRSRNPRATSLETYGRIQEMRRLNRIVRWTSEGIEYESGPRHAQLVVQELAVTKPVTTPLVKEKLGDLDQEDELLDEASATIYRSWTMRIGYLGQDRADLQRTVREMAKGMSRPANSSSFRVAEEVCEVLAVCASRCATLQVSEISARLRRLRGHRPRGLRPNAQIHNGLCNHVWPHHDSQFLPGAGSYRVIFRRSRILWPCIRGLKGPRWSKRCPRLECSPQHPNLDGRYGRSRDRLTARFGQSETYSHSLSVGSTVCDTEVDHHLEGQRYGELC